MGIPLKRFTSFDIETNLPTTDFLSEAGNGILNQDFGDLSATVDSQIKAMESEAPKALSDVLNKAVPDELSDATRKTKDFLSGKISISSLNTDAINGLASKLFPNSPVLSTMLKKSPVACLGDALGSPGSRRPKLPGINCGNGDRVGRGGACSSNSFAQFMQELTGKAFNFSIIDPSYIEKLLSGIGLHGYSLGLCNVFSSLMDGLNAAGSLDKNAIGRGAGSLLSGLAGRGDIMGIMDVGKSLTGINIKNSVPNISSLIMGGLNIPPEIKNRDMTGFLGNFSGAMNNIDSSWLSSDDGMMSVSSAMNDAIGSVSQGGLDLFKAGVMDKDPSDYFNDPSTVSSTPDIDYQYAGMSMGYASSDSSLSSDFPLSGCF